MSLTVSSLASLLLERAAIHRVAGERGGVDGINGVARPYLVGLTGSVAAGKTALANALATSGQPPWLVVSTDGFLHPNAVLEPLGRTMWKGFPDTYDTDRLAAFLTDLRSGHPVSLPVHSHEIYDILPDPVTVTPTDIVIVEGLHLLGPDAATAAGPIAALLDDCIYLDADHTDVEHWFVDRFMGLRDLAVDDPTSFYATFAAMTRPDAEAAARWVWSEINAVNLTQHIEPGRSAASIVVSKGADHSITSIEVRPDSGVAPTA